MPLGLKWGLSKSGLSAKEAEKNPDAVLKVLEFRERTITGQLPKPGPRRAPPAPPSSNFFSFFG